MTESEQRRRVGERFSLDELEQLCADLSERIRGAGGAETVDLDTLGRDGKTTVILALFRWCERRQYLPLLVQSIDVARPGIFDDSPPGMPIPPAAPVPAPPAVPVPADPAPSAAAVIAPVAPPGPMHAFVTGLGLGETGSLVIGACVLLENPDRVRGQVRALVEDALHDPILRTNAAIAALRRRTFDYATDDPEIRTRFIELLTVLSFEAYAYYAPAGAGSPEPATASRGGETALATVFEPLLADRMTNDRSRRFAIAVDGGLKARPAAFADLVTKAVARLNREDSRGVAGAEVTQAAADEPAISMAGYVAAILRRRLEGGTDLERRTFDRLHPQKIRLIHEIGTAKFFSRRRPLR